MTVDPYQLRNVIHDLDYGKLQQLSKTLGKLKKCKGGRECTVRTRPSEDGEQEEWDTEASEENSGDLISEDVDLHDNGNHDKVDPQGDPESLSLPEGTKQPQKVGQEELSSREEGNEESSSGWESEKDNFLFLTDHHSLNRFPNYNLTANVEVTVSKKRHRKGRRRHHRKEQTSE